MCYITGILIGASLSEPHLVDSTPALSIYIYIYIYIYLYIYIYIIVRPSFRKCTAFPFLRRCPIFQSVLIGMHVVYILSSKVLYNFCSHPSVAVMVAQQKREARLSRRRERERRLRALESAEQRESRLAKRRVRDRPRRAAQSTVQRERALQQRRERFTDETTENREARLETVRQRITSETSEEREARLQQL